MSTVLITGAAGGIGTMLRPRLARPGRTLRLLDVAEMTAGRGEQVVRATITDLDAMTEACAGVDAIVHLAGQSTEAAWNRVLDLNINGTYTVFEAARRAGVRRVVFASSNHAVGFHGPDDYPLPEDTTALPDTYYGVSKVAGEGLAALYAHRYGIEAIAVRILTCYPEPMNPRALSTWLSPDDCGRLFEACVTAPAPGFRVVYGVSANTRGGWVSLDAARELGYEPRDDAEVFAEALIAEQGPIDPADPVFAHLGGPFCLPDYDVQL